MQVVYNALCLPDSVIHVASAPFYIAAVDLFEQNLSLIICWFRVKEHKLFQGNFMVMLSTVIEKKTQILFVGDLGSWYFKTVSEMPNLSVPVMHKFKGEYSKLVQTSLSG